MEEKKYLVLAYYHFVTLTDPHNEILAHKSFFKDRDITCRIYISEQGLNGQLSGASKDVAAYIDWMNSKPLFQNIAFKLHSYHENVFPSQTIKYRKQLVALDVDVDLSQRGEALSPKQWREMLEGDEEYVLVDVRNDYEWKIGCFEGADLPPAGAFRDFNQYANTLKDKVDPVKTPVMMYCTGGIRCELYSALLKERGFEKVYQLEGGVINYGLKEGTKHWKGKLFVFDDRLSVPISDEENEVIGKCYHCGTTNDHYYNCANTDCNTLFLCCPECLQKFSGCCKDDCSHSKRLRPYHHQNPHKPFRKKHHYFPQEELKKEIN